MGSNVGDRHAYLSSARSAVSLAAGTRLLACSRVEETAPFGHAAQAPYLNQMIALEIALDPWSLLHALHRIERSLGRIRHERWGARTIDLDIVQIDGIALRTPTLELPHPGLAHREFWRRELAELVGRLERAA